MNIKLVQLDGELPNMALMKLSHYFKIDKGANVYFSRSVQRNIFEPEFDFVLASQIFSETDKKAALLKANYPNAIIGGTGSKNTTTVEFFLGITQNYKYLDYSIYPDFDFSIGMTQIGCSSKCPFCCVPLKEGKNTPLSNISEIYRGEPYPKKLILLDNDFQSRLDWQKVCEDIIRDNFQVAFIQGMNLRKITSEHGQYFKSIKFKDKSFSKKRFYCAWDNEKDQKRIERGLQVLDDSGFKRHEVTPYFLCNYWQKGLTEDVWNRFLKMAEWGLRPYAMIFEKWKLPPNDDLKVFQNWVNSHNAYMKPTKEGFEEYKIYLVDRNKKPLNKSLTLF